MIFTIEVVLDGWDLSVYLILLLFRGWKGRNILLDPQMESTSSKAEGRSDFFSVDNFFFADEKGIGAPRKLVTSKRVSSN